MPPILTKIVLIAIPLALYFEVMVPLYKGGGTLYVPTKTITGMNRLSSEYDLAINQARDLVTQASALKKQYEEMPQETKDKLNIMIPQASSTPSDPVRVMDEITTVITDAGFSANTISYKEKADLGQGKSGYTIGFSVKGSYAKFKELITALQSSLRIYSIQGISFSAAEPQEGMPQGLVDFRVTLETYYLK